MHIRAYSGYTQPMNGLVDDLLSAGQTFLAAQAAPVLQAIAPQPTPAPAPVYQAPSPMVTARPIMDMDLPAPTTAAKPTQEKCMSPYTMLIIAAIVYYLFLRKK